jgi:hypothetical protein
MADIRHDWRLCWGLFGAGVLAEHIIRIEGKHRQSTSSLSPQGRGDRALKSALMTSLALVQ